MYQVNSQFVNLQTFSQSTSFSPKKSSLMLSAAMLGLTIMVSGCGHTKVKSHDGVMKLSAEKTAPTVEFADRSFNITLTNQTKHVNKELSNLVDPDVVGSVTKSYKPTTTGWESQQDNGKGSYALSLRSALDTSHSIEAAKQQTRASKNNVLRANYKFLPKLNGIAERSRLNGQRKSSLRTFDVKLTEDTVGLNLTMPIFAGGQNIYGLRKSREEFNAAILEELLVRHEVELETVRSSFFISRDRKIKSAIEQLNRSLGYILQAARARVNSGEAGQGDTALAKANLLSAKAELHDINGRIKEAMAQYRSLTKQSYFKTMKVPDVSHLIPASLNEAQKIAIRNNPEIKKGFHQARANKYYANQVLGSYLPKVNLIGGYNLEDESGYQNTKSRDWSIGLRVTAPIVDLESIPAIESARASAVSSKYTALDTQRRFLLQLEQVWVQLDTAKRKTRRLRQQVNALGVAQHATREEYKAGYRSIIDVLEAVISQARARIALADTNMQKRFGAYKLLLLMGQSPFEKLVNGRYSSSVRTGH